MLKIEDKNRKWIDRARIDYMSKLDGKDRPDLESYLKAHGFDDEWLSRNIYIFKAGFIVIAQFKLNT